MAGGLGGGSSSSSSSNFLSMLNLPSPLEFAQIFVECPYWLMRFLEMYTEKVKDSPAHAEIHNTLLELYLHSEASLAPPLPLTDLSLSHAPTSSSSSAGVASAAGGARAGTISAVADSGRTKEEQLQRAGALLRRAWPSHEPSPKYDADVAVLLCEMHGFREGLLFLYERMKLHKEVMACYMQDGDTKGLVQCCKKLADMDRGGDASLWADVLEYLGETEAGGECAEEVKEVLEHLERDVVLPPLMILQTLAKNKKLTLAVVKDFVTRHIEQETRMIEEDQKAIAKYEEETASMRAELNDLKTKARIFQASKCSACTYALDLPAIHFLCMHSFHSRCLGDNESECPICAPANRTVIEMMRSLRKNANDHDAFFQLLQNSDDGFSVVAEYFGRGMLTPVSIGQNQSHQQQQQQLDLFGLDSALGLSASIRD
eukprot:TRINITY_DN4051_c0_g1_i1.p1 TRINITY_DN4051_c0_g1~~TRINITY_DN4051_c0_g1_i1.p1  ORF type:complete len:472 (+),score=165.09 TRINITY_DN4051_c0_g1_i1:127-1416(+)